MATHLLQTIVRLAFTAAAAAFVVTMSNAHADPAGADEPLSLHIGDGRRITFHIEQE